MPVLGSELYDIPEELIEFRDAIREISRDKIAPGAAERDEKAEYGWDVKTLLGEQDILGLAVPEEYGGTHMGTLMLQMAVEEIAKVDASAALILMVQELGSLPIRLFGSDELKQRFLPKVATGENIAAFALSEPEAGSDPASMKTRAVRDGDEWVINGSKNWITNTSVADFYVVFAKTDDETGRITAFVVEKEREGFSYGPLEHKMGIRSSPTGSPVFEDVRVPHENVVGEVGRGMSVALGTLERTRLGAAAQAVGIAQASIDYAAAYSKERIAFGKPISSFQGLQWKLADAETRTAAARELLYKACAMADRTGQGEGFGKWSSMAKLFASETAMAVTVDMLQILGGYGFVKDYPMERFMRDAKITQIYEGANEIQRVVIARSMVG
ncbi:acyl-CoA dehydrogenase family protein [Patulibacter sp.]|uniref:acyl-CoA dehydrogenase family protein n=1 Tax=Patulibacter sp. TaxID=1912859 RepID=UPI002717DC35|nr:acyl-CoA dehydrogenase family protein [Patulibacter sp.]MDO9408102.1 acyl-CoA dehydrogenase family protein [Patulibacter sp.]